MSRRGAVLLHGKWDGPDGAIAPLAEALAGCGLTVRRPHCCWSARRHYDVRFDQAIAEIGGETKALRAQGCDQVLLGGHSLGANAVLAAAAHGVEAEVEYDWGYPATVNVPDRAGFAASKAGVGRREDGQGHSRCAGVPCASSAHPSPRR